MRLAAQAKGGFYPTPEKVVDFIATLIRAPAGYYYRNREVIRILDPCCGAGGGGGPAGRTAYPGQHHAHRDLRGGAAYRPG